MILIKKKIKFLIIGLCSFLYSCETIEQMTGSSKPSINEDYATDIPDLVLPPDFGKEARTEKARPLQSRNVQPLIPPQNYYGNIQTVNPNITNYIAPKINIPSSPTPSHSLEKFKDNKKFTIGEWVYRQYVDGFKNGNIYYRPVYDKGYNFSRRYVPNQNIFSTPRNFSNNNNNVFLESPVSSAEKEYNSLDQLPIIE